MSLFANKMIQALCWTLFHSLWQALLLAFIAGTVIMCTKKSAVVLRYNVLTALLAVFLLTSAGTFYYETSQLKQPVAELAATGNDAVISGIDLQAGVQADTPLQFSTAIIAFLNANSRFIVLAWLCIIVFKCFQLFMGFWGIYRLKTTQLTAAGDYWNGRIRELAEMLYIEKPVQLVQSAIAKVPMVTGHFKPVILLPLGLLTSLPADEVEAILLHELAHIRRRDFLVNLLQSFCDILFFFNPAVLWVSGLIKEERENCCDDIAIDKLKNRKKFVHALIAFQEYQSPELAVTFAGKRQHLLNRVKRILTNNNKTLNAMEKLLLVAGLVVTSIAVAAFTQNEPRPVKGDKQPVVTAPSVKSPELLPAAILLQDTVPPKKKEELNEKHDYNITTTRNNKEYRIKMVDDKVVELYIDDKKIPDDKIDDYRDEVNSIVKEVREKSAKARAMADEAREKLRETRKETELSREKIAAERMERKRTMEEMQLLRKKMQEDRKISEEELQQLKAKMRADEKYGEENRQLARKTFDDRLARISEEKAMAEKYRAEADRNYREAKRLQDRKMLQYKEAVRMHDKMNNMRLREEKQLLMEKRREKAEVSRKKSQELVKDIMEDLSRAGVIKDTDDEVNFSLTGDGLFVNGDKQPDDLHKKLQKKYLKGSGDHIRYSVTPNSSHTDIHIDKQ